MLKYSSDDIVECLISAKNPNAAIKNFLKKEVQGKEDAAKFAKELRDIFGSKHRSNPDNVKIFVDAHLPEYENHLLCIARYAHFDVIQSTADSVISKFAEEFNQTYEVKDNSLSISDPAKFKKITQATLEHIDKAISESGRKGANFLKNVMLASIFDQDVLKHILSA